MGRAPSRWRRLVVPCIVVLAILWGAALGARAQVAADLGADTRVTVGAMVTSLARINPLDGSYEIGLILWCIDPSKRFDPLQEIQPAARRSEKQIVYETETPEFRYTIVEIQATVEQEFNNRDFPFDRQQLSIAFHSDRVAEEFEFVADDADSLIADWAVVAGWDVIGLKLAEYKHFYTSGFGGPDTPAVSRLELTIDVKRTRSALVIEKFIGMTVALLIASIIYLVPNDQLGVRVTMVTSAIFAAVGNRYTLDQFLGTDSTFGLPDKISLIVFGAIYAALTISIISAHLLRYRNMSQASIFNRWAGIAAVVLTWTVAIQVVIDARG